MRHLSLVFHFNLVKTQMSALSREGLLEGCLQLTGVLSVADSPSDLKGNYAKNPDGSERESATPSAVLSAPLSPPTGAALRKGARSAQV